jgi:hypothetical protein
MMAWPYWLGAEPDWKALTHWVAELVASFVPDRFPECWADHPGFAAELDVARRTLADLNEDNASELWRWHRDLAEMLDRLGRHNDVHGDDLGAQKVAELHLSRPS